VLKRIQCTGGGRQRLNRAQRVAVCLNGKHDAGTNGLAVEQDRACATDAVLASYVGSGKRQFLSHEVAEQKAGLHVALVLHIIDCRTNEQDGLGYHATRTEGLRWD